MFFPHCVCLESGTDAVKVFSDFSQIYFKMQISYTDFVQI